MSGKLPMYSNEYFENQQREADMERRNEKADRDERSREAPSRCSNSNLQDAAAMACISAGIGMRLSTLREPERDDDYRSGGWWVPCFIFVPGGTDGGN